MSASLSSLYLGTSFAAEYFMLYSISMTSATWSRGALVRMACKLLPIFSAT